MSKKTSHVFNKIWNEIIEPIITESFNDLDKQFAIQTKVTLKDSVSLKNSIEDEYKKLRHSAKILFYNDSNRDLHLDSRKLGAILCAAIIANKPIIFDEKASEQYIIALKKYLNNEEYNKWACSNILINYKIAYLSSLFLVFYSCIYLLENDSESIDKIISIDKQKKYADTLRNLGRFCKYPKFDEFDSFGCNMIISLSRTDFSNNKLDIEMYALQLWQIEMYTYRTLELFDYNHEIDL